MIEVKASIKNGERLRSYNAWNKEMPIVVKGIGGNRDCFQLPPTIRVIIPTDTEITVEEKPSKVYSNSDAVLKKGLALACGVQLITTSGKVELIMENISESLVSISNEEILGFLVNGDA